MNAPAREINWKKNLFFLWLSQILSMAGFAAVMPFIPIYLRDHLHIEDEQMRGLWVSAFNFFGLFSFCLSSPLWGVLADRYGRKLMLLRANYVSGILFPCLILAPNVIVLIIIHFFISAFSGTVTAAQTLVVTNTPEAHHGFALGTLSTALWSGNMAGFLAGGLIVNYFGFAWAFIICGILYLTGGVLVQFFVDENFARAEVPRKGAKKQGMLSGFSAGIWIILLLFVMMGVARRFDEPYIAMMVEKIHGVENTACYTGWISALAAAGGILSGVLIGRLCDRYSPQKIALPSLLVSAATMLLQAYAMSLTLFGGARFLNFLAAGGLEPAFQTMLSRSSPESRRGVLFGLASSLRMIGILLSSLFGGVVIYFFGTRNIFLVGAFLFLLLVPALFLATKYMNNTKQQN